MQSAAATASCSCHPPLSKSGSAANSLGTSRCPMVETPSWLINCSNIYIYSDHGGSWQWLKVKTLLWFDVWQQFYLSILSIIRQLGTKGWQLAATWEDPNQDSAKLALSNTNAANKTGGNSETLPMMGLILPCKLEKQYLFENKQLADGAEL